MSEGLFKSIGSNVLRLTTVAVITGLVLGTVYSLSANRINEQIRATERQALSLIFPDSQHDNDLTSDSFILAPDTKDYTQIELLGLRQQSNAYIARSNNQVSGIILPAIARDGYNGDISFIIGIDMTGLVTGIRVLSHRETPGLGDLIDIRISDWVLNFNGRSLNNPPVPAWTIVKDGGEFDQFTGATITPRAVTQAAARALQFFEDNKDRLLNL